MTRVNIYFRNVVRQIKRLDIPVLGDVKLWSKSCSWSCAGSLSLYSVSFRQLLRRWKVSTVRALLLRWAISHHREEWDPAAWATSGRSLWLRRLFAKTQHSKGQLLALSLIMFYKRLFLSVGGIFVFNWKTTGWLMMNSPQSIRCYSATVYLSI